jgi:uncharacterized protein YbcV (DUF1398 family)
MMDAALHDVMIEASRASDEGNQSFGEIVMQLGRAGIERYHQDFLRSERTYYMPNGDSAVVRNDVVDATPAPGFSAQGVEAAVRAVQAGTIKYKQFCRQAMAAGCVGYLVSLAGRRVVYYGRTGDTHVEYFPGAR